MTNIFMQIINKEIPAKIVYEDNFFIAILDTRPWTKGHTLLIPKLQVQFIKDLPPQFACKMMEAAQKVQKLLEAKLKCKSFNVMINDGEFAGQEVPHVHMHIIPRYNKKEMLIEHKEFNDSLDKIYALLMH